MFLAHAFGARYELPLPLILFVLGGALVVAISFVIVLPRAVSAARSGPIADRGPIEATNPVAGPLSLILLAGLIYAGVTGSQEVAENILPTWFWLITWIAVPLSCGLIGDWTRPVNPFRTLARLGDSDRARRVLLGSADRLRSVAARLAQVPDPPTGCAGLGGSAGGPPPSRSSSWRAGNSSTT